MPDIKNYLFEVDIHSENLRVITKSHFEMPWHLVKIYGGWRNRKLIAFFVHYAKIVIERYKNKVKYWMKLNEINNQMDTKILIFGFVIL